MLRWLMLNSLLFSVTCVFIIICGWDFNSFIFLFNNYLLYIQHWKFYPNNRRPSAPHNNKDQHAFDKKKKNRIVNRNPKCLLSIILNGFSNSSTTPKPNYIIGGAGDIKSSLGDIITKGRGNTVRATPSASRQRPTQPIGRVVTPSTPRKIRTNGFLLKVNKDHKNYGPKKKW